MVDVYLIDHQQTNLENIKKLLRQVTLQHVILLEVG